MGRTKVVFGVGNPHASVMFVGEAPGFNEDQQGEPFVGAAGKLLNDLLQSAGLSRSDIYIANVITHKSVIWRTHHLYCPYSMRASLTLVSF
jgi:DNA polymerase